jgi:hypothetical protein
MMVELKDCSLHRLLGVLSFIADNRDTQESMMWRLGSPAIKGGATTQALSASSL